MIPHLKQIKKTKIKIKKICSQLYTDAVTHTEKDLVTPILPNVAAVVKKKTNLRYRD